MPKILEKFMKKYWKNAKKTGKVREIRQSKKVGTMQLIINGSSLGEHYSNWLINISRKTNPGVVLCKMN